MPRYIDIYTVPSQAALPSLRLQDILELLSIFRQGNSGLYQLHGSQQCNMKHLYGCFPKMGYPQLSSIYIDRRFHLETIHFWVPP